MSIETFFTAVYNSINYSSVNIIEQVANLIALLDLQTGVPDNGYYFTNITDLMNIIEGANFLFELGYLHVNGVLVYAIKIGNIIYSVEPSIFHSLIFILFYTKL